MTRFEKRLVIVALIFVVVYLGAAAVTINTRIHKEDRIERLESTKISPSEGRLLMAELFLPMAILLTLTVCFIVVRKQRARKMMELEDSDDEFEFPEESPQDDSLKTDRVD
jgi:septation ring formation regulator EzrA